MKNLVALGFLALVIGNVASADFVPGRERAIMSARLESTDSANPAYPRAESLEMNKFDGSGKASSFTLVEDTGIRCIMAPCPSSTRTRFRITNVSSNDGVTRYEAIQEYKNIPANVRIAARHLVVTEYNDGAGRIEWDVEVRTFSQNSAMYYGLPEYLMVTQ